MTSNMFINPSMQPPLPPAAHSVGASPNHHGSNTGTNPVNKMAVKKSSGGGNKKGTSAERRATHNAVERARRESLNVRFLELAANLPATCTVRRPSKNLIVNKSLEFVRHALHNDAVLRLKLDEVVRQNQSLIEEVNQLRAERGLSPRANPFPQVYQAQTPLYKTPVNGLHNAATGSSPVQSAAIFGMPGLPQPLASAEFVKQVTEQTISFDASNASWFGNGNGEGEDDYLSTNASTDDFSAAASDHSSSPSLASTDTAATSAFHNGSIFPSSPHHQQQQQQVPAAPYMLDNSSYHSSRHNSYIAPTATSTSSTAAPSYTHYPTSHGLGDASSAGFNSSAFDAIPPVTPTTAAAFSSLMNDFHFPANNTSTIVNNAATMSSTTHSPHGSANITHSASPRDGSPAGSSGFPHFALHV